MMALEDVRVFKCADRRGFCAITSDNFGAYVVFAQTRVAALAKLEQRATRVVSRRDAAIDRQFMRRMGKDAKKWKMAVGRILGNSTKKGKR